MREYVPIWCIIFDLSFAVCMWLAVLPGALLLVPVVKHALDVRGVKSSTKVRKLEGVVATTVAQVAHGLEGGGREVR